MSHKIRSLKLYSTSNVSWKLNRYELKLTIETIAFILRIFRELQSLYVLITEEDRSKINMKWLEQQTTKFNHPYSFISHDKCYCYFWFGKHC